MLITRETREGLDRFFREIKLHNRSDIDTACKIEQVLAYLEILHAIIRKYSPARPLTLVDSCAGNCYLSFLVYFFYTRHDRRDITIHCVDTNAALMDNCRTLARSLGFDGMHFHASDIMEFETGGKPDMVFSLHACDNGTDRTLYWGIRHAARSILSVSCCQHTMRTGMRNARYRGITRHKIFKERLAYMAGDSLRALLLEMNGYQTDVIEFVSSRYTDKNVMLRATRGNTRPQEELMDEYARISDEFRIAPELERHLGGGG